MTRGMVTLRYPYLSQHPTLWCVSEIAIRMHDTLGTWRVVKVEQNKNGVTVVGEGVKVR